MADEGDILPEVAALRERLLQSELRTEAVRAGMIDLDGVKLIDKTALKLDETGGLVDGAGLMVAFKAEKPWLFGAGQRASSSLSSSSSGAVAPRAGTPAVKTAMEMTVEEWRAARANLLRQV